MAKKLTMDKLPLLDAVQQWCETALIENIKREERALPAHVLREFHRPKLTPPAEWRMASKNEWSGPPAAANLLTAWQALENEFRRMIECEQLFISGALSVPEEELSERPISGILAAELTFDFVRNVARRGSQHYLRIRVSRQRPACRTNAQPPPPLLSPETVRQLPPDTVAALLELHAEHVCKDLRVALNQAGKASVMALAAVKMKARAAESGLRPTLVEESDWLEAWCAKVAPSYQPLGAKTIRNKLGPLYRDLRAAAPASK